MKNILATLLIILGFMLGAGTTAYAALKVVQTPIYHLYTGESGTATTMRITPYPVDLDGVKLTMTDFGDTPVVTVDPGLKNIEEIEQFTGIVDNGDGTATITGISRDMQSKSPYTGSGTGRTHGSGAIVVFGNSPQIYGRLAAMENANTWSGVQTYASTSQPVYDGQPTFSNPLALVNYATLLATAISGAGTSTETTLGIVRLATFGQVGTGVASSTSGAPYVIENKFASSTYNGSTAFQGEIPTLRSTKDIDPNFVATSSGNNYSWGGQHIFNSTTTIASTGRFLDNASTTLTATTTIAASSTTTTPLILNTVPYSFPSTQGASSSVWVNDGHGDLLSEQPSSGAVSTSTTLAVPTSAGNSVTGNVYCVAPKIVSGGGYSGMPVGLGAQSLTIAGSYPSAPNTWSVVLACDTNGTCSGSAITIYAMCVNP